MNNDIQNNTNSNVTDQETNQQTVNNNPALNGISQNQIQTTDTSSSLQTDLGIPDGISQDKYVSANADVIGELRKEKIGKPMLVVKIFGLLVVVLVALPFVNKALNDENSSLYKLLHKTTITGTPTITQPEFMDASTPQALLPSMSMKYETLILKNFSLNQDEIKFTLSSYNNLIDLDQKEYFFEISSNNEKSLAYFKLMGKYDYVEKEVTYKIPNFQANASINYFGKVYEIVDNNYPEVTLTEDQNKIAVYTCTKDNKKMTYTFKNSYLIKIQESFQGNYSLETEKEYNELKKNYQLKQGKLGALSNMADNVSGFQFTSNINLETPGYMLPDDLGDYDYYPLDTQAKKVSYIQIGKGYDCK